MKRMREMACIAKYEMKLQLRSWVFRLFALLAVVGIVACHVYWQGEGNCFNWKAVALPCSMPLMNAYLFSVVQSLFLIVMVAEVSRRMRRLEGREVFQTRPYDNVTYYWGVLAGNFLLFLLLNVIVILVSVLTVNLTSFAPVGWKYYLFYLLTLNIPVWVFVAGMTLWLGNVVKSHRGEYRAPDHMVVGLYFSVALLAARDVGLPGKRSTDAVFRDGRSLEPGALCLAPIDVFFDWSGIVGVERDRDEAIAESVWHEAGVLVARLSVRGARGGVWSDLGERFLPGPFVPKGVSGCFRAALG